MKDNQWSHDTKRWQRICMGISGTALAVLLATGVTTGNMSHIFSQEENPAVQTVAPDELAGEEKQIVDTVKRASEAVVSIANKQGRSSDPFSNYQGNQYFNPGEEDESLTTVGEGSGVVYKIVGDKAYIVTNHHVVEGAQALDVTLKNGEVVKADLVGSDAISDLAVLTIDAKSVDKTLEFANSDEIQPGQTAIAIGSPLGSNFASSVTKGVVSGLNRSVPVDTDGDRISDWDMNLLQTDAAINPGNSGGALINSTGQLIGISSSKLSATGVEGMGFAIPSSDVVDIVSQLEANGEVVRPSLGVRYTSLTIVNPEYRTSVMGLDEKNTKGAFVTEVVPNSSADKAGLQKYDLITEVDGQAIESYTDLKQKLYQYKVGDTITIKVRRQQEEIDLTVHLEDAIDNQNAQPLPFGEEEQEQEQATEPDLPFDF